MQSSVPHHYHNHPTIRLVDGHDVLREQVSRLLSQVQAQLLVIALQHPKELGDVLDVLPNLGRMLDGIRWGSPDMLAYMNNQAQSQEKALEIMCDIVRTGDVRALRDYALKLERENPLPIVVRG